MAQVVERPLWEREVPGSSPGAPKCHMHIHSARACVFNQFHSPRDIAEETFVGDIKTVTSSVFRTPFPFDRLVLSANFATQTDGCLLIEVQVQANNQWSGFYKLGLLSGKFKTSFPSQKDTFGKVDTDELVLSLPATAYRYRLKFYGDAEVLLLAASIVRASFSYDPKWAAQLPALPSIQQVVPMSQMEQDTVHKRRICSPVSLYMALNSIGCVVALQQLLPRVFDQTADIYGNWLFNVAAAAEFGAQAYFRRFTQLAELEPFVSPQSLVIASLAFKKDELPGAPLEKTAGHLVLIRGYRDHKILVADPAAPNITTVLREYDAPAFARAWLFNKQGAAYIVRKK